MEDTANPVQSQFYSPLATIIITVGIFFGAQLLGAGLLSIVPGLLHWPPAQSTAWLTNSTWAQFLFIAIVETLTLLALHKFLKHRNSSLKAIGLGQPKFRHIFQALLGFGLYFVLYIVGLTLVSKLWPGLNVSQKQELGFSMATHGSDLWLIFISLVILPPVTEELLVRGFLYSGLKTKLTASSSAIIASGLFAAAHLGEGGKSGPLWIVAIDTFILSMVLCYIRDKSGSLWPCIGIHMIKNGLAFVLLFNIFHLHII